MAWLAGLMGGVHCVGMCGGIVAATLAVPAWRSGSPVVPQSQRHRQPLRFLLAYNVGRIASYSVAGGLVGWLGSLALLSQAFLPIQQTLFVVAQGMLILVGLYLAGLNQSVLWLERLGGGLWRRIQPALRHVLPLRHTPQAVAAGLLWGWLPCGLVYSVLISALATGRAGEGALLMFVFGLGTLPNLLFMGLAAQHLRGWLQRRPVRLIAGLTVVALGVVGLLRWL